MGTAPADQAAAAGRAPQRGRRGRRTVAETARWSRTGEAEVTEHALTVGAEQELDEQRREALIARVPERGDGIASDDLMRLGDVDARHAPGGGPDVRDVHDAGVGLAQGDLVEHGADIELLARRHERHPRPAERIERVPT